MRLVFTDIRIIIVYFRLVFNVTLVFIAVGIKFMLLFICYQAADSLVEFGY